MKESKPNVAQELESPSWYRLEFRPTPSKHIVLLSVKPLARVAWSASLRTAIKPRTREALIFVHGYNVTFETAARRTAQLVYDLNFPGVPLMYSWPSKGTLVGYPADEAAVEATVPHLISFLHEIVDGAGVERVHLVAHSMGNRALTNALRDFEKQRASGSFHQVILTAPDVDAQVFEEQIVPAIRPLCARLTLYASSQDRALRASMQFHSFFRAGQSGNELLVLDGLDTVDASRVDTDLLGHGYFAENKAVIDDLFLLVRHSLPPAERNLRQRLKAGRPYWILP